MKWIFILLILGIFFFSSDLLTTAAIINSTNYSGSDTMGVFGGNITGDNYSGDTASFYQQAIGYINNLLYSGLYSFSFNVAVPAGSLPSISILEPENETYITKVNLPLNFTAANQIYTWYNLDSGSNTTITGNITFNATNELHTLYLFANNTYGNSSVNVTFTVNTTKFIINYDNYSGSTRGSSTDFNKSTYEELQNLSGIVLENTDWGKIIFNESINMTDDSNFSDNTLNLDSYTSISNNHIEINLTELPNFNKSATIYIYNLGFSNPRVLKDGEACSSAICTEVDYSGGIFVFNVTQSGIYTAGETPSETPATRQPGGGGGSSETSAFTINKNQISISLTPGQVKTEEIILTNTGTKIADFKIENLLPEFIVIGNDTIALKPGESRIIPLYIIAKTDTIPNLYLGKIIVSSENTKKEVLISVEVESDGILLDVRAEILEDYTKILPGGEVLAEIRLFNLGGDNERKDVLIEYIIKDYEENEITKETESLAIETQTTFIKRISIPKDTRVGDYVLYVRAIYDEKIASSSDNFEIVSSTITEREKIYIITIIILIIIIGLVIQYVIRKRKREEYSW